MNSPRACLIISLAFFCCAGQIASSADVDLSATERKYNGTMAGIRAKYDKELKDLPGEYIAALGKYESALKKKGSGKKFQE